MKTTQEIEKIAKELYPEGKTLNIDYIISSSQRNAFVKGYEESQKDIKSTIETLKKDTKISVDLICRLYEIIEKRYTKNDLINAQIKAVEPYTYWNEEVADDARKFIEKLKKTLEQD